MAGETIIWDGDTSEVYTLAANWQGAAAPEATQLVYFPAGNENPVAGSDQKDTALGSFNVLPGYTAAIGSIADGKPTPLIITATTVNLDIAVASYLDLRTVTVANVTGAAALLGEGLSGLNLAAGAGAAAVTTLNINIPSGESVGLAALAGQSGTFTTINIDGDGEVHIGAGVTCTTVNVGGNAQVALDCACTTLNLTEGAPAVRHTAGAITTVNVHKGRYINNSAGTIGTTHIHADGLVDCSEGHVARAMTTIHRYGDGGFLDPNKLVTWTELKVYGGLGNDRLDLGSFMELTRAALA